MPIEWIGTTAAVIVCIAVAALIFFLVPIA